MGSRTIGSLLVRLGMDAKDADKSLKQFERSLKDAGRRMESVGRSMSIGFTAPFLLGMRQAIKAFDEEAQSTRKLEVALGRTSTALLAQAAAIQKTTTFADDAVINVQAYAAALGHSEAQVQKMTTAAVGLAAGLGIDLESAMAMLHKSTLGASKGLGNLIPGVKELTKEQLKSGAAIDMVTAKFGGYAEKMAGIGTGPLKQFQNRFGDLMEQFGAAALPLLNKIIDKFTALTDWFAKLSPATKEWVVQIGAMAALAGPVLLLAGNFIKLSLAVKAFNGTRGGFITMMAALKLGMNTFLDNKSENVADSAKQKYLEGGSSLGYRAQMYGAAVMSGVGMQFGQAIDQGKAAFGALPTDDRRAQSWAQANKLGLLTPLDTTGGLGDNGDGSGGGGGSLIGTFDGIARSLERIVSALSPFRANPAAGMSSIQPNLNPAIAGSIGTGGLAPLAGVGGHGQAIADMMAIQPDLTAALQGQANSVDSLNQGYLMLGNTIASVMTGVASSLAEGGDAFVAFGKAALLAGAQVVKAMLMASVARATEKGAAVAGAPGIIIGATLGIAAISIVEGLLSKIKTPKLAMGGATIGPTMAMIGDNPSGKEMVLPFERTGEFARSIGSQIGGGGSRVVGVIRGRDIHLVTSQEQGYASRRGSGNLITF